MSGHSQAPWRVNVGALSFDDVVIATVESTAHDALEIVCKRAGHNDDPIPNARLMAASPKLLEALKKAHHELNEIRARDGVPYTHQGIQASVDERYFSSVVDECRDAINSADGED